MGIILLEKGKMGIHSFTHLIQKGGKKEKGKRGKWRKVQWWGFEKRGCGQSKTVTSACNGLRCSLPCAKPSSFHTTPKPTVLTLCCWRGDPVYPCLVKALWNRLLEEGTFV